MGPVVSVWGAIGKQAGAGWRFWMGEEAFLLLRLGGLVKTQGPQKGTGWGTLA